MFATVMSGLAYVYFDQLEFCVVCVDDLGYVYVCDGYVVLDQCDELYCDDVRLGAVYEVFT